MELLEEIKNLGLTEKEARIYLALLPLKKATAYSLAQKSGLKKSTAYMALDNLISKGFVLKTPDPGKTNYISRSPKECLIRAQEKLKKVEDSLPQLMAMLKENDTKVTVSYFEGIEGIQQLYKSFIKDMKNKPSPERKLVGFNAHQKDTTDRLQTLWRELNEEISNAEIKRKIITTEDKSLASYLDTETQKKYKVTLNALPAKIYSSNISIEIYDNITQIVSHRYLQAIKIENPDISDVLSQIFEIVWKKTYKN